jgi:hypothetical protein
MSVCTTTNSWVWLPAFVTANVTDPAVAVAGVGTTFHSLSSTAIEPAAADAGADAAADGEAAVPPQPAATRAAATTPVTRLRDPDLDGRRMAHLHSSARSTPHAAGMVLLSVVPTTLQ